jgi:hypothetical protein
MNDTANNTKNAPKQAKSADGAAAKKTSPLVLVAIGVCAVVAGLLAYVVTNRLIAPGASPCEAAKAEILEVKALAPDPAVLDTRPDLSRRLSNAGRDLQENCIYVDGREFELANVDPWLGIQPPPSSSVPAASTTLAPTDALTPSTIPSSTPSTSTAIAPESTTESTTAGG